jgi:threonine dehydratase
MERVERPALADIERARAILAGVLGPTPLVPLHSFGEPTGIFQKAEIHQPIGSFKLRGVYHAVARLDAERRRAGLLTVSAGNTAQALAWTGRRFGVAAKSLMPENAPATKVEAVRAYGGTPLLVPVHEVFRFLREQGWRDAPEAFIHPWIDPDLIAGHGTLGLEILEELPEVDTVFVPVGGGGLLAGVASALKARKPGVRVIAVEPEGCPSFHAARAAGRPRVVECRTMCDGVAVPYITAELLPLLLELADDCVLVSEEAVSAAVRRLATRDRIVAEPAGALAVAAAEAALPEERGIAVAVVTGGSIDAHKLAQILQEAE